MQKYFLNIFIYIDFIVL